MTLVPEPHSSLCSFNIQMCVGATGHNIPEKLREWHPGAPKYILWHTEGFNLGLLTNVPSAAAAAVASVARAWSHTFDSLIEIGRAHV